MNKQDIRTIILQEDRIKELEKRNQSLESGFADICKENNSLRRRIKQLERYESENELNKVNI